MYSHQEQGRRPSCIASELAQLHNGCKFLSTVSQRKPARLSALHRYEHKSRRFLQELAEMIETGIRTTLPLSAASARACAPYLAD